MIEETYAAPGYLRPRAEALLSEYVRRAALEMDVISSFERQRELRQLHESLLSRLRDPEGFPNEAFNGLAESLARCIVLYECNPDAYARLVAGAVREEARFVDSIDGLRALDQLVRALADDHDYVFNSATACIEVRPNPAAGLPALTPAKLLTIIRGLDAAPSAGH